MPRVAIILTSHNRRDTTVACLQALDAAAREVDRLDYTVFLTDDGSTDGTSDAVHAVKIPVRVFAGPGDLFWNRGMIRSWEAALTCTAGFDGFLLLNDDTVIDRDAITSLLTVSGSNDHNAIVVGAVRDPESGSLTYGGVVRTSRWHPARVRRLASTPNSQDADTFNANCVYVPMSVANVVGTLDPCFQHGMGDFDYGYRAKKHGFRVVVAPNTIGTCARNSICGTWRDRSLPLMRRIALLRSPKGLPQGEWKEFLRRHGAPLPTLLALTPYVDVVVTSVLELARRQVRRLRA